MGLRLVPASGTPIDVERDQVVVGREPSCDIVLSDGSVSRKHARLEKQGESWKVVDNGSANGTYADGQRIAETTLRKGMDLRFGAVAFKVDVDEPPDEMAETIIGSAFPEPEATVLTPAVVAPPPAPPRAAPAPPPRVADPDVTEQAPRPRFDEDPVTAYVPPAERNATPPRPTPAPPAPPPPAPAAPPRMAPPQPPPPVPPAPKPPAPPPPPPRAGGPPPPPPPARPGMPPPVPAPRAGRPAAPPPLGGPVAEGKKKGPLFWGLIGCCGCLLLMLLVSGVGGLAVYNMTSKPVEAIRAAMVDAKGGNLDAAYARTSSGFQQRVSKGDFAAFVVAHPSISGYTDSTFLQRSVENKTATVSGMLTAADGTTETAVFKLVQEGDDWKIDEMTINGLSPTSGMSSSGASGSGSGLSLETVSVDKEPADGGVKVTVTVRATGYATRREGDAFMVHLVEDLETFAPGGVKIDGLSKEQIQAINRQVEDPDSIAQEFVTDITLLEPPDGDYQARITIRDIIGGSARTEEVTFSLP